MNEDTYLLAKACVSAVFVSLMNAYNAQGDEKAVRRHERQADFLENKFKNEYNFHPQRYIDLYESAKRIHSN